MKNIKLTSRESDLHFIIALREFLGLKPIPGLYSESEDNTKGKRGPKIADPSKVFNLDDF